MKKEEKKLQKGLFDACKSGDLENVKILISKGVKVNVIGDDFTTPLIVACQHGHLEIITYLVDNDADVTFRDEDDLSVLNFAGEEGHLEIVKYFVEKYNIDLNNDDDFKYGDIPIFRYNCSLPILKYLVSKGLDINRKDCFDSTLFIEACGQGDLEKIKYLISIGADVNAQNDEGDSGIICAACEGNVETVIYLYEHGVDLSIKNKDGYTVHNHPFVDSDVIKYYHRKQVIKELLK